MPSATGMSAILMRYWFWSSRMLSRMRTLGMSDADLGGHVLPHALDALQQVAAALRVGQANQAHADLDFHRIDGQIVFDALLGGFCLGGLGFG